jgi:broad specificity phosphatase PhoE
MPELGPIGRRHLLGMLRVGTGCAALAACTDHRHPSATAVPLSVESSAAPVAQTLYLISHAEKPTGDSKPHGSNDRGEPDKHSLTPLGWARARALVGLFSSGQRGIAVPQHLFASRRDGSRRPLETITPLAEKLGLPVDSTIAADDVAAAAEAITRTPGTTLMAWEHHAIPAIAAALGDAQPAPRAKWPGGRFDVIWVFNRAGTGWRFSQVPELLLDGDRPTVI